MVNYRDELFEEQGFLDRYFSTGNYIETGSAEAFVGSTAPDNIGAIAGVPTASLVAQTAVVEVTPPIIYTTAGTAQYGDLPKTNLSGYVPNYDFGTDLVNGRSTAVVEQASLPLGLSTTSIALMAAVAFFYFKGA